MKNKLLLATALITLSILGIHEVKSNFVIINLKPMDPLEYEIEWLNGQVTPNPYGNNELTRVLQGN